MKPEPELKYFWLVYSYFNAGGNRVYVEETISGPHPIVRMGSLRESYGEQGIRGNLTMHNWKELTKQEYDFTSTHNSNS